MTTIITGNPGVSVLIFLTILLAFTFVYESHTKLENCSNTVARMHEQQKAMREEVEHLRSEHIALRSESNQLKEVWESWEKE